MKKSCIIINTGRGGLLDTPSVIDALKHRNIGGVALDVYEFESSYFFKDWSTDIMEDE